MNRAASNVLRIGEWRVNERAGEISRGDETARLEVRTMRVLLCLAEHAGEVVSSETLLNSAWGDVAVSQDSVYQAVASLRRLLGDDPRNPRYLETVPRMGYRLVARVEPWSEPIPEGEAASAKLALPMPPRVSRKLVWTVVILIFAAVAALWLMRGRVVQPTPKTTHASDSALARSVAVIPFLDLTEGMKDEEFADGITEELIDRISKIPGLQVAPPTSSFYFKDKQVQVAEIARTLRVSYVLDGSLRKSGTWVRVDVRLIKADNGYVVWSETYDQPKSDIFTIQDDIARKVAEALRVSIANSPAQTGAPKN